MKIRPILENCSFGDNQIIKLMAVQLAIDSGAQHTYNDEGKSINDIQRVIDAAKQLEAYFKTTGATDEQN